MRHFPEGLCRRGGFPRRHQPADQRGGVRGRRRAPPAPVQRHRAACQPARPLPPRNYRATTALPPLPRSTTTLPRRYCHGVYDIR
ncbi:hypothetical protein RR46_09392 [Papilio xuthus]|uniref:Uncharacterized protein n=1 Tax=Papilio xuthus TaxID=66420 RepID=A0A194PXV7_PAPXU|nr:hypothetical protein RR46_09392 [Papilio xuthus]